MNKTKTKASSQKIKRVAKASLKTQTEEAGQEIVSTSPIVPKNKKLNTVLMVVLSVLVLVGLGYLFKDKWLDKVVVAMVNGRPISRLELNQRMTSIYGKETLENLIVERLISDEAAKNKVIVSEKEIDDEVAKIVASLGNGAKIEDILAMQGMTMKDLRQQIKLKLQVNKILGKDINITDEEIKKYLTDNASTLTATDEAGKKQEAKEALFQQKISEKIQSWIGGLEKGNVIRFLK